MDALELAEKAKYHNIIDMAVGFSAMIPLFHERSADLIKENLTDLFETLERLNKTLMINLERRYCHGRKTDLQRIGAKE
jgi:hypothetical protein